MRKIGLVLVALAMLFLLCSFSYAAKNIDEETITGTLVRTTVAGGETEYQLKLDKPIIFNEGSKSERVVRSVKLTMPADLQEKARKLEGQHVVVTGPMDCTMHYSPWTASCDMVVEKIAKFGEAVTHGSEMEDLLGISVNLDRKEITISVASTGCTDKTYFLFEVKDNVLIIIRTKRDSCKAMPKEVHLTYSFEEIGIDPNETFKIANSFLVRGDIWQKTR